MNFATALAFTFGMLVGAYFVSTFVIAMIEQYKKEEE